jgi:hypothetical protein
VIHSEEIKTDLTEIGLKIRKLLMIIKTLVTPLNIYDASTLPLQSDQNGVTLEAIVNEIRHYMTLETLLASF